MIWRRLYAAIPRGELADRISNCTTTDVRNCFRPMLHHPCNGSLPDGAGGTDTDSIPQDDSMGGVLPHDFPLAVPNPRSGLSGTAPFVAAPLRAAAFDFSGNTRKPARLKRLRIKASPWEGKSPHRAPQAFLECGSSSYRFFATTIPMRNGYGVRGRHGEWTVLLVESSSGKDG